MGRSLVRVAVAVVVLAAAGVVVAGDAKPRFHGATAEAAPPIPCTCRFSGRKIMLGRTVCMKTSKGYVLARCSKTLNNTSWDISKSPCLTVRNDTWQNSVPGKPTGQL